MLKNFKEDIKSLKKKKEVDTTVWSGVSLSVSLIDISFSPDFFRALFQVLIPRPI
jgi:hypothetical protein